MNDEALMTGAALVMLTTEAEAGDKEVLNFSNNGDDVGKISAIEKERTNEVEVSFVQSGQNRSNFNEDLLNSSGSIQNNGPGSGEYELKSRGVASEFKIDQDLEVTIDIDWPAERIEEEYRKQ